MIVCERLAPTTLKELLRLAEAKEAACTERLRARPCLWVMADRRCWYLTAEWLRDLIGGDT